MKRAIFLSYRRADTADVVGRVNDALVGGFGEQQIFRDVDSIPMGVPFAAHISDTLKKCRIVLAFIGPDWLDARDEQGRRRLDDPNDLVRVELETALETPKLLVVPLLVNGARMPSMDSLPVTLRELVARNAGVIRRDPDFRTDMTRLVDALRTHLRTGRLDLSALGGGDSAGGQILFGSCCGMGRVCGRCGCLDGDAADTRAGIQGRRVRSRSALAVRAHKRASATARSGVAARSGELAT